MVTAQQKSGGASGVHGSGRNDEERVLISEVLVKNKDGEELERKDLEGEALAALKACRANSALTVREVQEDVHRIISSGYFSSCMPVAVDTRDGIQLVFQVCGTHHTSPCCAKAGLRIPFVIVLFGYNWDVIVLIESTSL